MVGRILPSTSSRDEKWYIPNEIDAAIENGVGESFKRYIINTLKDMLKDFDSIQKVTLNKIIFNRDITYDDIIKLRLLCKSIRTDIFTYNI